MPPYLARCYDWQGTRWPVQNALQQQAAGRIVGDMKLKVWKSRQAQYVAEGFPWLVKWVPR